MEENRQNVKKILNQIINEVIKRNKPQIKLLKWSIVATWSYKSKMKDCAICRNDLTSKCYDCLNKKNIMYAKCHVSEGECGHQYHYHCIERWIKGHNTCPIDRVIFKYLEKNVDDKKEGVLINPNS